MSQKGEQDTYLLGSEKSALQRYRLFNEIYMPGTTQRLANLSLAPDSEVLEIGCGIGETACYFAQHLVPDGHVTAFDKAPDLVELARQRSAELGIENISFFCESAQDFSFEAGRFGFAHTRYVLSYLSDAAAILQKIHKSLAPSGIFLGEEIAQLYVKDGRAAWYENMTGWFAGLIKAGGGNPNYGLDAMPADMIAAGFTGLDVSAYWPFEDQQKVVDTLRIALTREMKQAIVGLNLASGEDVDDVASNLAMTKRDYRISASAAIQITGKKAL